MLGGTRGGGVTAVRDLLSIGEQEAVCVGGLFPDLLYIPRMAKIDSLLFQHQVEPLQFDRERERERETKTDRACYLQHCSFIKCFSQYHCRTTVFTAGTYKDRI